MTRTEKLRDDMLNARHSEARVTLDPAWDTADLPLSLPERKAEALCRILDNMPLYIGDGELIVGSRTVYGARENSSGKSDMNLFALPKFVNGDDIGLYGKDCGMMSQGHITPDYKIVVEEGIGGVLDRVYASLNFQTDPDKRAYLMAVIRAWRGLSRLFLRYSEYAATLAAGETGERKWELSRISANCRALSYDKPKDFWQASQLVWLTHLSLIIESYQFVCYGRLDQILGPFHREGEGEWEQQLIDCLVIKMYDQGDIIDSYLETFAGQHTLTLGGVTPEGEDAVNPVTMMFLDAVGRVALPEPMVEIRYSSKNPKSFLRKAAEASVKGINSIAYYKDDVFTRNLKAAGIPERDANNYAFDLCQDILVPGKFAPFNGLHAYLGAGLMKVLRTVPDEVTYEELERVYIESLCRDIDKVTDGYNRWCEAVSRYNNGEREEFLRAVKSGEVPLNWSGNSPMAPLPLASPLFYGCVEDGVDVTLYRGALPFRGMDVEDLVVGINSLAAVHKCAIDDKKYKISEIVAACGRNYEGDEVMRRTLWNAPKWGNGDSYVDGPALRVMNACLEHITSRRTIWGTPYLAGLHQAHPVAYGWGQGATPEGRRAKEPVPVTLTPENGTMKRGPLAVMDSVAKVDDKLYSWNVQLLLQFTSSVFAGEEGVTRFCDIVETYFAEGGPQLQTNIVNPSDLRDAQAHPENYKNLIVRLWGIAVQFVNLSKEVQDEFIARYDYA